MSNLTITLDTDDARVLSAAAKMLLNLAREETASIPVAPITTKPTQTVVPAPTDEETRVPWIVDGREYTAEQIRDGGFTIEQLHDAGWFPAHIAEVLQTTLVLVQATIDAMAPDEEAIGPKMYTVGAQSYTAQQMRMMDWDHTDLFVNGWSIAKIAEVLGIPIDDVEIEDAPPVADTGVKLDTKGMPWDPRIHAGTKTTIADGSWKMKRGVDKEVVEQVEAELINLMAIEPETKPVVIAPPAAAETVIAPPVVIAPPAAEPADDGEDAMTFAQFLKACSAKMTAGETNMQRILEVVNGKGVGSLQLVGHKPDLIPELWAAISQHQKVAP